MSSVTLFQASPSLKKAAGLINSVDGEKFTKVLARVLQRLHIKDEPVFSDEECAKLQIALELESQELELVLETTSFILQQAAYHLAKPPLLHKQLQEIGLAEDKASLFGQVWGTQGKVVVEKLRSRQFYPTQLQDVKWRLNLQMAQSCLLYTSPSPRDRTRSRMPSSA